MKKLSVLFVFLVTVSASAFGRDDTINKPKVTIDQEVGPTREDIEAGRAPSNWRRYDRQQAILDRQEQAVQRQEEAADMLEQDTLERQEQTIDRTHDHELDYYEGEDLDQMDD